MAKKVTTLLLVMACVLLVNKSLADEPNCAKTEIFQGLMFELSVTNSLDSDLLFRFCVGEHESYLLSELEQTAVVSERSIIPGVKYQSKVRLTADVKSKIDDLYKNALLRSRPDNIQGKDGSTWCFRPKSGSSYAELCYWSPSSARSNERALQDIANLGEYLLGLSGLQAHGAILQ